MFCISLGGYCLKNLVKNWEFRKSYKGGIPYRRVVYRREVKPARYDLVSEFRVLVIFQML